MARPVFLYSSGILRHFDEKIKPAGRCARAGLIARLENAAPRGLAASAARRRRLRAAP